jgi:hypothetical protein
MGFLYLMPGIASVVLFVLLWRNGLLGHPRLVGVCCLTGLVLQFSGSRYVGVWLAGLLVNVGIALYLSIRLKLA